MVFLCANILATIVCDIAVSLGEAAGMTLCGFLNPAVSLEERARYDIGVIFAGCL